jgi:hypothetical protein
MVYCTGGHVALFLTRRSQSMTTVAGFWGKDISGKIIAVEYN